MRATAVFVAWLGLLSLVVPLAAGAPPRVEIDGQTFSIGPSNARSMAELVERDATEPPTPGSILFVGSSTIRMWRTLAEDMAPLPVYNRGFGGARTWEALHFLDDLALKHRPRLLVFFCGSNDTLVHRATAEMTAKNFERFVQQVRGVSPQCRFIYLSITRTPSREPVWPRVDTVNALVADFAARHAHVRYFEMNQLVFDDQGRIQAERFLKDGTHLARQTYRDLVTVLRPVVREEWALVTSEEAQAPSLE